MSVSVHIYSRSVCKWNQISLTVRLYTNVAERWQWLTCDNGRHAPADGVVEPHGAVVDVALLRLHAVDVEALHEHPGKRGHEEVVQQDGHNRAQKLHRRECKEDNKQAEKKSWGAIE